MFFFYIVAAVVFVSGLFFEVLELLLDRFFEAG